jgi:hypothetical protein
MVNGTRDYNNVEVMNDTDGSLALVTTPSQDLDSGATEENGWVNPRWQEYNGYYRKNQGGTKAAITQYAVWIAGRGYTTDSATQKRLDKIKGNGTDTFKGILKNALRVKKVNGDSFAEVITSNNKAPESNGKNIINIKPLNAGRVKTFANDKGIITGYQQTDHEKKLIGEKLEPWQIFHLSNDREGDEIHGISVYEGSTELLDKIQQLDNDMTVVFHRYVMPFLIFKAKTDKAAELAKLQTSLTTGLNKGKGLIIPDKALDTDDFKIPQFSTLNPLDWRKEWKSEAIKDLGMPELHLGNAGNTNEASSKMVYFQFEQPVADEQEELEKQIFQQLGIKLKLNPPLSIDDSVSEDENKDGELSGEKKSDIKNTAPGKETKNPSNSSVKKTL